MDRPMREIPARKSLIKTVSMATVIPRVSLPQDGLAVGIVGVQFYPSFLEDHPFCRYQEHPSWQPWLHVVHFELINIIILLLINS